MNNLHLHRRTLLKGAGASLALAALNASGMNLFHAAKTFRVGLIGTGWYGKNDLFRLIYHELGHISRLNPILLLAFPSGNE